MLNIFCESTKSLNEHDCDGSLEDNELEELDNSEHDSDSADEVNDEVNDVSVNANGNDEKTIKKTI